MRSNIFNSGWRVAIVAAGLFVSSQAAYSQTSYFWNVADGNFSTPGSWNPAGPPDFMDNALINNGGTSRLTTDSYNLADFDVASTAGSSGTFIQSGGDLAAQIIHFGERGTATASITNGMLRAAGPGIFVGGENNGGTGVFSVSGASSDVSSNDDIISAALARGRSICRAG